jgi:hypothetical protein
VRVNARLVFPLVISTGTLGVLLGLYLFGGLWVVGSVFVGLGASLNHYAIMCSWHEHARRTWVIASHLVVVLLAVIAEAAGWSGASWAAPLQLGLVLALFAEFLLLAIAAGPSSQPPPLPPSATSRSKPPPLPFFAVPSGGEPENLKS